MQDIENKNADILVEPYAEKDSIEENAPIKSHTVENLTQKSVLTKSQIKKLLISKKEKLVRAFGTILVAAAVIIAFSMTSNNHTTPIKTMEKYANAEEFTLQEFALDYDGHLGQKQIKRIFKILRNSDYFLDMEEEVYDVSISNYEDNLDKFGDNFITTYTILDHYELTKSDLRNKRSSLQEYVYELESLIDETEDFSTSDWGNLAEDLGLLKAETKDLIKALKDLANEYGRIEVSKGYIISVLITTTGDELEEPLEEETEIYVYKVNGRWIGEHFGITMELLSDLF